MNTLEQTTIRSPSGQDEVCAKFTIDDLTKQFIFHDILVQSEEYVFSVYVKSESSGKISVNGNNANTSNEWTQYKHRFTADNSDLELYFNVVGIYYLYHTKLELGSKATDWTPAPEDTQSQIDELVTVTETHTTNISVIQGQISSLIAKDTEIENALGDKVTTSQYNSIKSTVDSHTQTISSHTTQLNTQSGQISSVSSRVTTVEQGLDSWSTYVSETAKDLAGRITTAESTITQHTSEIELRVTKAGVISAINQTAETVKISASKVELSGYVTLSSLTGSGTTNIDGSRITTGIISADRIDVANLFTGNLTINKDGSASTLSISSADVEWTQYIIETSGATSTSSIRIDKALVLSSDIGIFKVEGYMTTRAIRAEEISVNIIDANNYNGMNVRANYIFASSDIEAVYQLKGGTIYEGGTALSSKYAAASHGHTYLDIKGTNTVTSDSTANWGVQSNSVHWYDTSANMANRPSDYGFLVNYGFSQEVHQIWLVQAGGDMLHRGGNANGFGAWRTVLDSVNYSSYALPITGGTVTGNITVNKSGPAVFVTNSSGRTGALHVSSDDNFGLFDTSTGKWLIYSDGSSAHIGMATNLVSHLYVASNSGMIGTASGCRVYFGPQAMHPVSSGTYNCGSGTNLWKNVYATGGVLTSSDERMKNILTDVNLEDFSKYFMSLEPIAYKWIEWNDDKIHFGLGAQTSERKLIEAGYSSEDFSMIQHDQLDETSTSGLTERYSMNYHDYNILTMMQTQKNTRELITIQSDVEQLKYQYLSQEERLQYVIQQLQQAQAEIGQLQTQLKALA